MPEPAVASPIPRYHPLPTHPVFEPQPDYLPPLPLDHDSKLLAPSKELGGTPTALSGGVPGILSRPRKAVDVPPVSGEPTPAPLPPEPTK